MTTIVYHENIIACDSRETDGSLITTDSFNKITKKNGVVFVCSGADCDLERFIEAYNGIETKGSIRVRSIIDDHGTVYVAGVDDDDGFWKEEITGRPYAIGNGEKYAWTALDLGCTAVEAVKMAMKRDIHTGGRVRIHRVEE